MAESRQTRVETQPAPTQAARANDVADNEPVPLPHAAVGSAFASGRIDARRLTPQAILALQRTAGNAAVNQLLAGTVQPTGSRGNPPLVSAQTAPPIVQRDDDRAKKEEELEEKYERDYQLLEKPPVKFSDAFSDKYLSDPKPSGPKDKRQIHISLRGEASRARLTSCTCISVTLVLLNSPRLLPEISRSSLLPGTIIGSMKRSCFPLRRPKLVYVEGTRASH